MPQTSESRRRGLGRRMSLATVRMGLCLLAAAHSPALAVEATSAEAGSEQARARRLIEKVEEHSADTRSLSATLVQEKHLALFERPLILRGKVYMKKPDLFALHIETPLRYSMVIAGERLSQWDEDTREVQAISLAKNPAFKLVLRQMRGWLSGSYLAMLGEYDATVLREDPIELEFSPRKGALAHGTVERVRVAFDSDPRYVREIEILDRQGDRTVFKFADTRINAEIDPSVWEAEPSAE